MPEVYVEPTHVGDSEAIAPKSLREIDHRVSNLIEVRLLWDKETDAVSVSVVDGKTGESFSIPVREGMSAKRVFEHPFAYVESGSTAVQGAQEAA